MWRAPAPGARVAGVDPALRARVSACLAFAPEGRPDSAAALAAALGAWRRRRARPWRGALLGLGGVAALTAAAVWSAGEPPAPAPVAAVAALHTLTLQPGPLEGRDTYVDGVGWYRNDNFGAEQALRVGHRPPQSGQTGEQRGFLAFDLTRLPAGAEVEAATLTLTCIQSLYLDEASTLEVHAVRESGARTPWREGTGLHDALLDGVAWSGTFAGQGSDPRTASARPELDPPDVEPAALDRATVRPFAGEPFTVTLDVSPAVRAWQRDPASNLGLRLALAAEDRTSGCKVFATSDAVDPAARPRLEVRYRGAPAASAPDLAQQRARARAAARRLLADAEAEASRGAWDRALQACTRAIEAAPFWGAPFLARAGCAERLGLPALARLDAGRAVGCLEPALGPPAYAAVARLGLGLENPLVRRQALGALTLLALSQRMDPEVSALYQGAARLGVFAPDAPASWAPYAEGQLLTLEASRARAPEAGADVLFVLALLRAARGAPEAAADYARACAADPGHSLAGIDPPLGPGEVRLLETPPAAPTGRAPCSPSAR
ncbi:MAG: DNRLRE domain-containing protein [Planctomycetota bacterium]